MTTYAMNQAVRKASETRLLADMRSAARVVAEAKRITQSSAGESTFGEGWARGYCVGVVESASLTRRAALMTAFGA
jgi:hypothetical protein